MSANVLAIDIDGMNIVYGIVSPDGKVLEEDVLRLENGEASEVVRQVKFLIKSYKPKVEAVGIGFPGIVNPDSGEIIFDERSQKYEVDWDEDIPIAIDNDANLAALAEAWVGETQDVSNFIFIVLGESIDSGIFLEGHLYRGSHYSSGEISEVITSNKSLDCISGHNFPGEFSESDKSTLSFVCEQLSQGIQSIAAVVDPTVIIIGGSRGIKIWPLMEDELKEKIKHLNILVQPSALGPRASLIGAAKMALDEVGKKSAKSAQ